VKRTTGKVAAVIVATVFGLVATHARSVAGSESVPGRTGRASGHQLPRLRSRFEGP